MSLLRIAGSQMTDDLQQRHFFGDAPPNRRRKSGSLKEPLSSCIIGPLVAGLEMVRWPKPVAGRSLYLLHPGSCFASALRVQSPRRSLADLLFSRRRLTA
jgi:hypothetical protein